MIVKLSCCICLSYLLVIIYLPSYHDDLLAQVFLRSFEDRIVQRKIRIFLVDDERDLLLTYKAGLELRGFLVDVFDDPLVALTSFKTGKYDLVITDIKMPKMNGFELHREIQKIDKVKVCFITAFVAYYDSLRYVFDMRDIHCIIKKPIEIDDLARRIKAELVEQ